MRIGHYVYRWRQGPVAVSRLSHRPACAKLRFSGYLLLDPEWRLAWRDAKGRVRRIGDQSHHGARADAYLSARFPPRCASHGCADWFGGRSVGVLSRFDRSEEHTSELQSLMRISYAVFCLKKKQ